jgi:ABC-type Zn uptake system ZnuABC Zn-binding protein ZnuA
MAFFRGLFSKDETPAAAPLRRPLEEKEVDDVVQVFLTEGIPNPTNQQIADKLGRNVEEVTNFRPIGKKLPTYYDDDYGKTGQESLSSRAISPENVKRMQETDPIRAKYLSTLVKEKKLKLGGRRTNKNKKKHKKLSRRRRHHHSKKNRKSIKRK